MTDINNHLRDINSIPRIGRERRVSRAFEAAAEICMAPPLYSRGDGTLAYAKHAGPVWDAPSKASPYFRHTAGLRKGVAL